MLKDLRNGKVYIGKHNGSKKDYWSSGLIPNRIANKHGKQVFEREILHDNIETAKDLNLLETFYIEKYNSQKNGYNLTSGGEGGNDWMLNKTDDEIKRILLIKSQKMKNRTFSEDTILKMKKSHTGKKLTEEHKQNIAKAIKLRGGKPHSEETKQHLSAIKKGIKNPNHSRYMKENNPASVMLEIEGILYKSMTNASELLDLTVSQVKYRVNSKNKKWNNWKRI